MESAAPVERGDIVMAWLIKLAAVLSVAGVLGYDGFSLLHVRVSSADAADHAASAASDVWAHSNDVRAAYASAEASAVEAGGTVPTKSFAIDPDGTVHLAVHETAPTFLLRHLGPLKHWASITSQGMARPSA